MEADEHANSAAGNSDETNSVSRRRMLQTTAATIVGGAGLSAAAGSAAADTDDIMEVDFRYGTPSIYDAPQGEDILVLNIHGYTGSSASVSQARQFQQTARGLGWTETVTAVTWDDSGLPWSAERSARDTGGMLANWLRDYKNANPNTTVRLLGHSMGGIVTMETLAAINGDFRIASAAQIGSYEVASGPCDEFYGAIERSTGEAHNYFSRNDSIARLGSNGASCSASQTPPNYKDVDVTDSVGGHTEYKSSRGCVNEIIKFWG